MYCTIVNGKPSGNGAEILTCVGISTSEWHLFDCKNQILWLSEVVQVEFSHWYSTGNE